MELNRRNKLHFPNTGYHRKSKDVNTYEHTLYNSISFYNTLIVTCLFLCRFVETFSHHWKSSPGETNENERGWIKRSLVVYLHLGSTSILGCSSHYPESQYFCITLPSDLTDFRESRLKVFFPLDPGSIIPRVWTKINKMRSIPWSHKGTETIEEIYYFQKIAEYSQKYWYNI